jgi:hypothetical protein
MTFECEFCKKTFATKYILTKHQKLAKYCLEIQESLSKNQCEFCLLPLPPDRLVDHMHMCKEKAKVEHERYEKQEKELKDLKDYIDKLEKQNKEYKVEYEGKLLKQEKDYEEKIRRIEIKLEKFENAVIDNSKKPSGTNNIIVNNTLNTISTLERDLKSNIPKTKRIADNSEYFNYFDVFNSSVLANVREVKNLGDISSISNISKDKKLSLLATL